MQYALVLMVGADWNGWLFQIWVGGCEHELELEALNDGRVHG